MRCPKCHYISFEAGDRCRNCGYEFSLANTGTGPTDLALNDLDEELGPPLDLALTDTPIREEPRREPERVNPVNLDRAPSQSGSSGSLDLPLFGQSDPAPRPRREPSPLRAAQSVPDDMPLVRPSPVPRPPLAVRRPTPDTSRIRSRYAVAEAPRLDLDMAEAFAPDDGRASEQPDHPAKEAGGLPAPPLRRLGAGLVDLLIVGGIDAGVLYFTLKLCGLPLSADGLLGLPAAPMLGFLLLLDGGYAVTFTAAVGQTIGKMATGLRVVCVREDDSEDDKPDFGFAILRTAAYFASLLPVGLGFLPALLARDRRALHDRLAETRVVTM